LDKKEYLSRYHNLIERIEKKKQYIAFCEERPQSIPGQDFSQERVDCTPSYEAPFVKWVLRGLDAERELKELGSKASIVKDEIESTISKMIDEDEKLLLTLHYIDWLSWSEIENAMYASKSSLIRLHRRALDNLVL
jgi:hypothetical protein